MYILVDDPDRENEGDLIIPAQYAIPQTINFMAKHGRGLICLALTKNRIEELELPLMNPSNIKNDLTAFTVSIEAKEGVTTGISAAADIPVVTPSFASIETVKAVKSFFILLGFIKGSSNSSILFLVNAKQINPLPCFAIKLIV